VTTILTQGALRALVEPMRRDVPGDVRDRALIYLGFESGCRRSELVALDVGHLSFGDDGLEVTIRRSKKDQEGFGRKVGIPYGGRPRTCPVRAVRDLDRLGAARPGAAVSPDQPLRQNPAVAPDWPERGANRQEMGARGGVRHPALFAGHSLRSGLATAAAKAGKSERSIMKQTGHRSVTVVRRYIRDAELFDDNAAAGMGSEALTLMGSRKSTAPLRTVPSASRIGLRSQGSVIRVPPGRRRRPETRRDVTVSWDAGRVNPPPQNEMAKLQRPSGRSGVVTGIVFTIAFLLIAFLLILTVVADWLNGVIWRRLRRPAARCGCNSGD
jgi:hypothetical protein